MTTASTYNATIERGDEATGRMAVRAGVVLMLVVVLCSTGVSAEAAHAHEQSGPPLSTLLFPIINFVLFLYILRRAGGEIVREYLVKRRGEMIQALDAAVNAQTTAEKAHGEIQARLKRVEEETTRLAGDMRAIAELERDRRARLATETATRIGRDATLIAAQEVRRGTAALRDETVSAAMKETLALLKRQVKAADQDRFLGEFVDSMRVQP